MPDEIEFQNIKKQYPEFFEEFPAKLVEMITSEETVSKISGICLKNRVENQETIEKISYHIISVLLGKLPIEILPKALVVNLKIDTATAKKISEETNQLIFSRVKDDLADLYRKDILPEEPGERPEKQPEGKSEEEPKEPPEKDTYREPVE